MLMMLDNQISFPLSFRSHSIAVIYITFDIATLDQSSDLVNDLVLVPCYSTVNVILVKLKVSGYRQLR